MTILCTNDDGYLANGIRVLASAARELGPVVTVAPDREQSAASHSLTIHRPLRARRVAQDSWVVDGTPTDCVLLAVNELLPALPDVCLSGVNHGSNMGEDVLYSGTVAAAMEATVMGIPAIAVSHIGDDHDDLDAWDVHIRSILGKLIDRRSFPRHTLFNVNLPACAPAEVRGIRVTSLGERQYADSITRANDPSGREYFWIGGGIAAWSGTADSDFQAVADGYVSVTPLHLDVTDYELLQEMRGWDLDL